tara:strand:- start:3129 stop:3599 length:471 start_codon:yes stop_codon:yes gene_type:complete
MNSIKMSLFAFLAVGVTAYAQETTLTTGGNANGNEGTVSYSIGQAIYANASGEDGSVSQGVQQAFDVSDVTGFEEVEDVNLSAFPNPTTDYVMLDIARSTEGMTYQLFNLEGELIKESEVTQSQTQVSLAAYPTGVYLLKLINNDEELKAFKIIKH